MTTRELWDAALATLELDTSKAHFRTFLRNTKAVSCQNGVLQIAVPNGFVKEVLSQKFYHKIKEAAEQISQSNLDVKFVLQPALADRQESLGPLFSPPQPKKEPDGGLFKDYTFQTFVVGFSNRLAHAVALAISQQPGRLHNPFFIYSGVGLGKTHLIHAIGTEVKEKNPKAKVLYVAAETFANELIESIQYERNVRDFRNKYRQADLLLVDDIQFIAGKEATQEEFFNTFNSLYYAKKQIVVTSDKPPKEIKGMEERLISRFAGGIVSDIQAPDTDLRLAILKKKTEMLNLNVSQEALRLIAEEVKDNIRELEGTLSQVAVLAESKGKTATAEEVLEVLGKNFKNRQDKVIISPKKIISEVCTYYTIREKDIKGARRLRTIARPRQVAMFLLRQLTDLPLTQIGEVLGGRDHTTILHGVEQVEGLLRKDWQLENQVRVIKNQIVRE